MRKEALGAQITPQVVGSWVSPGCSVSLDLARPLLSAPPTLALAMAIPVRWASACRISDKEPEAEAPQTGQFYFNNSQSSDFLSTQMGCPSWAALCRQLCYALLFGYRNQCLEVTRVQGCAFSAWQLQLPRWSRLSVLGALGRTDQGQPWCPPPPASSLP